MTVVLVRSYSRYSRSTSWESERYVSGSAARRTSPMRASWSGLAQEWMKQTATASASAAAALQQRVGVAEGQMGGGGGVFRLVPRARVVEGDEVGERPADVQRDRQRHPLTPPRVVARPPRARRDRLSAGPATWNSTIP